MDKMQVNSYIIIYFLSIITNNIYQFLIAKILKLLPFFPLPPEMIRKKRKKIKNSIDFEKKVLVEVENVPYYEDELWIEVEELIHLLIFQIVDDDNE